MPSQQHLESLRVEELKCLRQFTLFLEDKAVTGIFGPNGSGKSTLLHALACVYKPSAGNGENHKFSDFFKSDSNFNWIGTDFTISYSQRNDMTHNIDSKTKTYKKKANRWIHDYAERPERPVFYIGISTSIPDIELIKTNLNSVNVVRDAVAIPKANEIRQAAAVIMNIDYSDLYQSSASSISKKLLSVQQGNPEHTTYQSLNMGAGEQRLLRMLTIIHNAPQYSLIIIDEIDLTLHTAALQRFLDHIVDYATNNHLQIVFTSHREAIAERKDINVRHIYQANGKTICLSNSTPECLEALTGVIAKPLQIYVEDEFAREIMEQILIEENALSLSSVLIFGSSGNAFIAAAGLHITGKLTDNVVIVLDGDVYKTEAERLEQMKCYSGTEVDLDVRRSDAASHITQFCLPPDTKPEVFVHDCLCRLDDGSDVCESAKHIVVESDSHEYVNKIADRMGVGMARGLPKIIAKFAECPEWPAYSEPIRQWINDRLAILRGS